MFRLLAYLDELCPLSAFLVRSTSFSPNLFQHGETFDIDGM